MSRTFHLLTLIVILLLLCTRVLGHAQTPDASSYAAIRDFLRKNNLLKPE